MESFGPDRAFGGQEPFFAFGCRLYEACTAGNVRFEYPGVHDGKLWAVLKVSSASSITQMLRGFGRL